MALQISDFNTSGRDVKFLALVTEWFGSYAFGKITLLQVGDGAGATDPNSDLDLGVAGVSFEKIVVLPEAHPLLERANVRFIATGQNIPNSADLFSGMQFTMQVEGLAEVTAPWSVPPNLDANERQVLITDSSITPLINSIDSNRTTPAIFALWVEVLQQDIPTTNITGGLAGTVLATVRVAAQLLPKTTLSGGLTGVLAATILYKLNIVANLDGGLVGIITSNPHIIISIEAIVRGEIAGIVHVTPRNRGVPFTDFPSEDKVVTVLISAIPKSKFEGGGHSDPGAYRLEAWFGGPVSAGGTIIIVPSDFAPGSDRLIDNILNTGSRLYGWVDGLSLSAPNRRGGSYDTLHVVVDYPEPASSSHLTFFEPAYPGPTNALNTILPALHFGVMSEVGGFEELQLREHHFTALVFDLTIHQTFYVHAEENVPYLFAIWTSKQAVVAIPSTRLDGGLTGFLRFFPAFTAPPRNLPAIAILGGLVGELSSYPVVVLVSLKVIVQTTGGLVGTIIATPALGPQGISLSAIAVTGGLVGTLNAVITILEFGLMSYITLDYANDILAPDGDATAWADLSGAGKLAALDKASRRIETIPFEADSSQFPVGYHSRPRYSMNIKADPPSNDAPLLLRIAHPLAIAVAMLAMHYARRPYADTPVLPKSSDDALAKSIADMPLVVQSAIWPYMSIEARTDFESIPVAEITTGIPRTTARSISFFSGAVAAEASSPPIAEASDTVAGPPGSAGLRFIKKVATFTVLRTDLSALPVSGFLTSAYVDVVLEAGLPPGFSHNPGDWYVGAPTVAPSGIDSIIMRAIVNGVTVAEIAQLWGAQFSRNVFTVGTRQFIYAAMVTNAIDSLALTLSVGSLAIPTGVQIEWWLGDA